MTYYSDNIIAIATAPQSGAIGIVRVSGKDALSVMKAFFKPNCNSEKIKPRYFYFGHLIEYDGGPLDQAMAVFMQGPNSFTGEDVVEFHCHGSQILLRKIVKVILEQSKDIEIRGAEPGEFSKRAFLNGKIDLTQAESIHEIIKANSDLALKSSLKNLDGELNKIICNIRTRLRESLALIEASFEFPEEDIQTFDKIQTIEMIKEIAADLRKLSESFKTSKLYDEGVSVAIVGKPNVGKSSLLNALLIEERAIVTDIAGTTRDTVEGSKIIGGLRFNFYDTAGLRETADKVEQIGIQKSKHAMEKADLIIHLYDEGTAPKVSKEQRTLLVRNKIDLHPDYSKFKNHDMKEAGLFVSSTDSYGLERLEAELTKRTLSGNSVQNNVHINERQNILINEALTSIERLIEFDSCDQTSEEILAEEIRLQVSLLEEITGEINSEAILGEIFERFCIGK